MPPKILQVIQSLSYQSGGPLRTIVDLAVLAREHGVECEILGYAPLDIPHNPIGEEHFHLLHVCNISSCRYAFGGRSWCRKNLDRYDLVILHGSWSTLNFDVSASCHQKRIPYLIFPHGSIDLWSVYGQGRLKQYKKQLYWNLFDQRIVLRSNGLIYTLPREMNNARRTFRLPDVPGYLCAPAFMPEDCAAFTRNEVNPSLLELESYSVALFLGRIHPKKRPDLLIDAWARAEVPKTWKLVIAGPGEEKYLAMLERRIDAYDLGGKIRLVGSVSGADKEYLFTHARWFLLSSELENFGIAVLEAASRDCAIAISDQVYLADEFPDGAEILPLNVEAWADFMRGRMQDISWRDAIAKKTARRLRERFGRGAVASSFMRILSSALGTEIRPSPEDC